MHKIDHFNKDIHGWSLYSSNSTSEGIQWEDQWKDAENPHGGHLSYFINDDDGGIAYLTSSPRWEGDESAFFDGKLVFDIAYNAGDDRPDPGARVSMHGGGLNLYTYTEKLSEKGFSQVKLDLNTNGGWIVGGTNAPATKAQIMTVLSNFENFTINARYQYDAYERGAIDNFGIKKAGPPPAAFAAVDQQHNELHHLVASPVQHLDAHHVMLA